MNRASGNVWNFRVQKIHQAAQNAALGLAAQSEKNKIVARQNRVGDLRQYGFLVSMNSGE